MMIIILDPDVFLKGRGGQFSVGKLERRVRVSKLEGPARVEPCQ